MAVDDELFTRAADEAVRTNLPQVVESNGQRALVVGEQYVLESAAEYRTDTGEIPEISEPTMVSSNGTKIWVFQIQGGYYGMGKRLAGRDQRFDHLTYWKRIDGQIMMEKGKL